MGIDAALVFAVFLLIQKITAVLLFASVGTMYGFFFLCGLLLILGCDKQHCYRYVHKYASSFAGQILKNKNAESKKCIFHILRENCQFAFEQDIPNLNT